ncbi:hypothetical protein [Haladaptatus cibarius]|uniref:hypothetical protein n=1 Tax=Haladaptatus cibarius TaxID=453847 RepID=UPI000679AB66|nr:hypothetical protein [Haladaptatus cibarius]
MLPRPTTQDDDDGLAVEELYGKPQHEISAEASEQELYGDPQHDTPDRFSTGFNPDFGHAMNWFDYPKETASRLRRGLFPTER